MTHASTTSPRREPVVETLAPDNLDAGVFRGGPPRRRSAVWIAVVAALVVATAAWIVWRELARTPPRAPVEPVAPPVATAPPPAAPAIRHPIEGADTPPAPDATPLPSLADSDAPFLARLHAMAGGAALERLLVTPNVVRRIVATVDNLPRAQVASQVRAVRPAEGALAVDETGGRPTIARANAARYAAYVAALDAVDTRALVALYVRHYPLFQEAYRELGYPDGYFNDRVVDVIDHLLATPELRDAPALVQPKVLYEYANPDLEARSAGQKALMRLGADNQRAAKARLREIRSALARDTPPR